MRKMHVTREREEVELLVEEPESWETWASGID